MRDEDRARILHMIEAADAMAQFVAERSPDGLDKDRMLLFALVHAIEVFGEAASRISPETRAAEPQIPWGAIVSMRNRLIHGAAPRRLLPAGCAGRGYSGSPAAHPG
jgi:uncharacterized protein with HEPN domain